MTMDCQYPVNFQVVKRFAYESGLIRNMMCYEDFKNRKTKAGRIAGKEVDAILLLMAPFLLDTKQYGNVHINNFEISQRAAYASVAKDPIFRGPALDVNINWTLLVLNFFRWHALRGAEATLNPTMAELDRLEVPQMWNKQLDDRPAPLGKMWKGTYSYLDTNEIEEIRKRRRNGTDSPLYMDKNIDHDDAIQTIQLFEHDEMTSGGWHPLFDHYLDPKTDLEYPEARAQHRSDENSSKSYRFNGVGYDDETFFASGWLNPLPPQQGIPGWQRMTMMKYFKRPDGTLDDDAFWAYEGVVLPGGQVIVGRWWAT